MSGNTWGTTYHITYTATSDLSTDVLEQMHRIDSTLSMFNPASELSQINASGAPIGVSCTFTEVFELSQRVHTLSHGAFDPTVAPLVDLWGFGRKDIPTPAPDSASILSALERVGIDRCTISDDSILTKAHPQTEFDFSAVAKGYGVDCIAEALTRARVHNYMVEVGGEIALAGRNPRGELWRIQIDAPVVSDSVAHERLTVLEISDCCIATSGNYRRYLSTSSGLVGHTLSPSTGRPVATSTLSATVIAPTCALADALATACMALPAPAALEMIANVPDAAVMLVLAPESEQEPTFRILTSGNWPAP